MLLLLTNKDTTTGDTGIVYKNGMEPRSPDFGSGLGNLTTITWLSRVGRTLHSMGKMEGTLGRSETDETGQRSRIGLEEGKSLTHKKDFQI